MIHSQLRSATRKFTVRRSRIHGRGLFSELPIKKDEIIGVAFKPRNFPLFWSPIKMFFEKDFSSTGEDFLYFELNWKQTKLAECLNHNNVSPNIRPFIDGMVHTSEEDYNIIEENYSIEYEKGARQLLSKLMGYNRLIRVQGEFRKGSCVATCCLKPILLQSVRDIEAGEELCCDYSDFSLVLKGAGYNVKHFLPFSYFEDENRSPE
mmetsp:Transcript_4405/g.5439  ORF Transcript_4405/g.5439 Transcript_4405/m.5439 type:complete len:207 (+) Transcript_4405:646-1266(+)